MDDLDKLRALLALLREFGVEKYEDHAVGTEIVLAPSASAAPKPDRPQPEDPAVAAVRKLQAAFPGGVDLG